MNEETRQKIDEIGELNTLVNSPEWANDNVGALERRARDIMSAHNISAEDQSEWLYEDN